MNETLFFVIGLSLVALALIVSAVGLRMEKFPPSRGALIGGTLLVAAVVLGTTTFAWLNAEDEQEHRNELIASGEELSPQQGLAEANEATEEASEEGVEQGGAETASADGAAVYEAQGCGGCHALAAADSTATTGPDLDATLPGKDEAFIEESIVDPNAEIAKGYPPDVMPQTYGELSPEDLDALVQYLSESTSGS
jgi:mono/diheme cytochrome c family protein